MPTEFAPIIGSTERGTYLPNMRLVRVDDQGHIEVVIPAGVPLGIDLQQVASQPVVTGGINGLLAVGGAAADGAAASGNPVAMGGQYRANPAAAPLADLAIGRLLVDSLRRLRMVGSVLDDAVADATEALLKLGAVAVQVPTAVSAAGDMAQLTTDLERFLRVVTKAYDTVSASDRSSVNTIADDRDESAQVWAAETNTGAGTNYYPSSSGYEISNRDHLTLALIMTDTTTTIQASNAGATWVDITPSVLDLGSGTYLNASFPTGAGLSANWLIDIERANFRYIRCAVVTVDAGNATGITAMTRKA